MSIYGCVSLGCLYIGVGCKFRVSIYGGVGLGCLYIRVVVYPDTLL